MTIDIATNSGKMITPHRFAGQAGSSIKQGAVAGRLLTPSTAAFIRRHRDDTMKVSAKRIAPMVFPQPLLVDIRYRIALPTTNVSVTPSGALTQFDSTFRSSFSSTNGCNNGRQSHLIGHFSTFLCFWQDAEGRTKVKRGRYF